ncbi:hypothetical protein G7Y89_g2409 [Cudoniella acicularis]|uniref:AAA+ ATPase domain-containing protein n=1 Tax=Cudoniella acicularis TaxID=354080 RepID=A0A8H4RV49_9HELO|nr:hypothetical protein G7Y89_g2409 [Cudoniella acicularis]
MTLTEETDIVDNVNPEDIVNNLNSEEVDVSSGSEQTTMTPTSGSSIDGNDGEELAAGEAASDCTNVGVVENQVDPPEAQQLTAEQMSSALLKDVSEAVGGGVGSSILDSMKAEPQAHSVSTTQTRPTANDTVATSTDVVMLTEGSDDSALAFDPRGPITFGHSAIDITENLATHVPLEEPQVDKIPDENENAKISEEKKSDGVEDNEPPKNGAPKNGDDIPGDEEKADEEKADGGRAEEEKSEEENINEEKADEEKAEQEKAEEEKAEEEKSDTAKNGDEVTESNTLDELIGPEYLDDPKEKIDEEKADEEKTEEEKADEEDEVEEDPKGPSADEILEEVMVMVGLEAVKAHFLKTKSKIEMMRKQNADLTKERFSIAFMGNPGTGKTTIARLYANFLKALNAVPGKGYIETNAMRIAYKEDVRGTASMLEELGDGKGGIVFVDDAHQLVRNKSDLQHLLGEVEIKQGKIVFIFAGYTDKMEEFLGYNPSVASRVPNTLKFQDYTEIELQQILVKSIKDRFQDKMIVEGGNDGLYVRIFIHRLVGRRGQNNFGNVSAVETAFSKVLERQAYRLHQERKNGNEPGDFFITKEDMIGPGPTDALSTSKAWKELQEMVGLEDVIASIKSFFHRVQVNYRRELEEKPLIQVGLNKVFLGPPGTGKTTVGKLYGQILADLGLLTNGEVMVRNPSDFIGEYIGHSEAATKRILNAAVGKVLIIDEAHMLYPGKRSGGCNKSDIFRVAVIDTLVSELTNTPGEDRCVILMGYEEPMMELFHYSNPGLARRFPLQSAFVFETFSIDQLTKILDQKVEKEELELGPQARQVAIHLLTLARDRPNFGNGGEVDNLLARANSQQQKRIASIPHHKTILEAQDFDPNFERMISRGANCRELFKDFVGSENIISQFEGYQQIVAGMRMHNIDPRSHIPFTYLFKGPPGTGKTTTARKIGQIYYDIGFLSEPRVIECSVSDLVGEYKGWTGPKVIDLLDQALGKVLFVDEAYRLGHGDFATEAVSELVDCITKPRYANKLVIILAGYESDMNNLLRVNQGLASRFSTEVVFHSLPPEQCLALLHQRVGALGIHVGGLGPDATENGSIALNKLFNDLAATPSWANGRDIETLAKIVIGETFRSCAAEGKAGDLTLSYNKLVAILGGLLEQRRNRVLDFQ